MKASVAGENGRGGPVQLTYAFDANLDTLMVVRWLLLGPTYITRPLAVRPCPGWFGTLADLVQTVESRSGGPAARARPRNSRIKAKDC